MKKIFITYGDSVFEKSKKRIIKEAKRLNFFDHIIAYGPEDLPSSLISSPLMKYRRGGGYWCWKPWIIWHALQQFGDDAIVFYADAGCTLQKSSKWSEYIDLLMSNDSDTIVFHYNPNTVYSWVHKGELMNFVFTLRQWTKYSVIKAFDDKFADKNWLDNPKILGGFIIARGKDNKVISKWYDLVLSNPEYFSDSEEGECNHPEFVEHRHDQIVLGILAYLNEDKTIFLKQEIDGVPASERKGLPVIATRIKDLPFKIRSKNKIKYILNNLPFRHTFRKVLGEGRYNRLKKKIRGL